MERIRILNTELVAATQERLLEELRQGVVVTPNIDHLVKLQSDRELYELYRQTEWVICDSRLLYLFTKLLPESLPQAIPGSSFFPAFYAFHKDDPDCRIFLLGGLGDVAQRAMDNINRRVGRQIVVGAYSPSYGFETNEEENDSIVSMVNASGATVVPVCVGCPKQEKWIYAHKHLMPGVRIWMALGATIDFEAGNVKRAPAVWQKLCLEWFYRFCREPRRLFRRYFVDDMKFFWYFGRQVLGLYNNPFDNKE
jgi:exopolysaccharide biosynthesis WecB/TagA/CpsF family protein